MSLNIIDIEIARSTDSLGYLKLTSLLTIWLAIVVLAAVIDVFDVPAPEPALPTLIAVAAPIVVFGLLMTFSPKIRHAALSLDPILLTEFQAWRILGGLFLVVYAFGHLPGFFAWPAGLGDVAVGIAAPFIAYKLRQNPNLLSQPCPYQLLDSAIILVQATQNWQGLDRSYSLDWPIYRRIFAQ